MALQRDPVSVLFDPGARALLTRAYASPGQWVTTRLANPSPTHIEYLNSLGIDWEARDTAGAGEARTRWARAFIRSVYYQHKWYSPTRGSSAWSKRTTFRTAGGLSFEVGRALPGGQQAGTRLVPGRQISIKLQRGGQAKDRAVANIPSNRVWADQGPAWADPRQRDW